MYKTEAIITKVENFKENHLSISVYSSQYGQKSLVVFGGKSKKKNRRFRIQKNGIVAMEITIMRIHLLCGNVDKFRETAPYNNSMS